MPHFIFLLNLILSLSQLRLITHEPHLSVRQVLTLPRPSASTYTRPITAYLFFAPPAEQLSCATDLILDFPGGGFVAMNPEHHEERLRLWATHTGRPVLSIDYGKAPECECLPQMAPFCSRNSF